MIDMRGVAAFLLPALAEHFPGIFRHYQYRGHAERVGYREIAGKILEHRRPVSIDAMQLEEAVVGLRGGFGLELGGDDVENIVEMRLELEARQHRVGVT